MNVHVCMLCYVLFREPQSSLAAEIVSGSTTRRLVYNSDSETIDAFIANLESDDEEV